MESSFLIEISRRVIFFLALTFQQIITRCAIVCVLSRFDRYHFLLLTSVFARLSLPVSMRTILFAMVTWLAAWTSACCVACSAMYGLAASLSASAGLTMKHSPGTQLGNIFGNKFK
jgi:hypothetical protein